MLTAHHWVAYAVIAVAGLAAVWGGVTYFRRAEAGATLGQVLALVQTLCVAQVALGLLLALVLLAPAGCGGDDSGGGGGGGTNTTKTDSGSGY